MQPTVFCSKLAIEKSIAVLLALCIVGSSVRAAPADGDLVLVSDGRPACTLVVSPKAGKAESLAAADRTAYVEKMSGAKLPVANTQDAITAALGSKEPLLILGQATLAAEPALQQALNKVAKKDAVLGADAIVLRRVGNRLYVAGNNDEAHYYAAAELLRRWGCRWYMPGEFGECVPRQRTLSVGPLDYSYAPPFEVRHFWLAWNAEQAGREEFLRRNFGNNRNVPSGHALAQYTKELIPPGKTMFNVPIAEEKTAEHVAKQLLPAFAKGEPIMLGLEDGIYESDSPRDKELRVGLHDKYFLTPCQTDPFMAFYNNVSRILLKQHPASQSKIGFLAYSNITIPPQRKITAEKPLVAYLAPIDIDPNHGMDDPRSPPRQEYREIMYRWAEVMQGRLVIYDYDQGMLVWRDIPNPSLAAMRQDIKHYRKAGILGISTESRGALATTFLNLFVRLHLLWNPDADVDQLLKEFYPSFYGPAAEPMATYWGALLKAWDDTIVTEHEYFVIPAIYTPELVTELEKHLRAAEARIEPLRSKVAADPNAKVLVGRILFTRLTFDVLRNYAEMVRAAATEADYKSALAAGERGLAARLELAKLNLLFTTRVVGVAAENEASGPAWWPGEVKQYRELLDFTNGKNGTLVAKLPLEWAFRRDPHDTGIVSGWAYRDVDLSYWRALKVGSVLDRHRLNPGHWELLRSDLYAQAQGIVSPDYHSYTGHAWYRSEIDLTAEQTAGNVRLRFPGLFNECWLYVNGSLVAHRPLAGMWWMSDYKFEWDVDLRSQLRPGKNTLALRLHNPHHFGGMFRRPFLYRATR